MCRPQLNRSLVCQAEIFRRYVSVYHTFACVSSFNFLIAAVCRPQLNQSLVYQAEIFRRCVLVHLTFACVSSVIIWPCKRRVSALTYTSALGLSTVGRRQVSSFNLLQTGCAGFSCGVSSSAEHCSASTLCVGPSVDICRCIMY